ncbi:MAG: hypothetical protein IPK98_11600 [Chloracidobacterium sp.]|nr:hypothetical protein [Chloracidobacterium sp.]
MIDDLVIRDNRFKTRMDDISEAVIGAKRMALSDEPAEKIADFIAKVERLTPRPLTQKLCRNTRKI